MLENIMYLISPILFFLFGLIYNRKKITPALKRESNKHGLFYLIILAPFIPILLIYRIFPIFSHLIYYSAVIKCLSEKSISDWPDFFTNSKLITPLFKDNVFADNISIIVIVLFTLIIYKYFKKDHVAITLMLYIY